MFKYLIFALVLAFAAATPILPISPVVTYSAGSLLPTEYVAPSQAYYGSHIYAAPYAYNYIGGYRSIPYTL